MKEKTNILKTLHASLSRAKRSFFNYLSSEKFVAKRQQAKVFLRESIALLAKELKDFQQNLISYLKELKNVSKDSYENSLSWKQGLSFWTDSLILFFSIPVTVFLFLKNDIPSGFVFKNMFVFLLLGMGSFLFLRTHILRTNNIFPRLIVAVSLASVLFFPLMILMNQENILPDSFPLLNFVVCLALYWSSHKIRTQTKRILERTQNKKHSSAHANLESASQAKFSEDLKASTELEHAFSKNGLNFSLFPSFASFTSFVRTTVSSLFSQLSSAFLAQESPCPSCDSLIAGNLLNIQNFLETHPHTIKKFNIKGMVTEKIEVQKENSPKNNRPEKNNQSSSKERDSSKNLFSELSSLDLVGTWEDLEKLGQTAIFRKVDTILILEGDLDLNTLNRLERLCSRSHKTLFHLSSQKGTDHGSDQQLNLHFSDKTKKA